MNGSLGYPCGKRLRILRLLLHISETSAPYYQFSLPQTREFDITLCSFFKPVISPASAVTVFPGDNTMFGYLRLLRSKLFTYSFDVIHIHSPHLGIIFLLFILLSGRRFRYATIYTVHNSFQSYNRRNQILLLPLFAAFKHVVCCGQSSFNSLPKLYRWLAGKRLSVIPNGVDIDAVDRVIVPRNRQKQLFTVIWIGRLVPIKRPFDVLHAFHQYSSESSQLVMIGDGPLYELLQKEIKHLGLQQRVKMTGVIPRKAVYEYLADADLYISTSAGEGMPVAVLEAMACRCAVVLSDIPSHREIADGADFIPLVPVGDLPKFVTHINRFSNMSTVEKAAVDKKCRELVEKRYSLESMLAAYKQKYLDIVNIAKTGGSEV